jgi:hypothetical protein
MLLSQGWVKVWFMGCNHPQNSSNDTKVPFILKYNKRYVYGIENIQFNLDRVIDVECM